MKSRFVFEPSRESVVKNPEFLKFIRFWNSSIADGVHMMELSAKNQL